MSRQVTFEVMAMNEINFSGNVIPTNWYKHLRYDNGKPNLNAIIILSEIVYWYRPSELRDEATGELLGYKKKFKADKLQRSYRSFGDQFGFTKKQARDALIFLEDKGLIIKELRNIAIEGVTLSNVLFIGIVPAKIKAITQVIPMTSKSHPPNIEVTPSLPESQTYTETTTETTTDINGSAKNSYSPEKKAALNLLVPYLAAISDIQDKDDLRSVTLLGYEVAQVCKKPDISLISIASLKTIARVTIALNTKKIIKDDLKNFEIWWYNEPWEGKKGQAPTPGQVGDMWGQFEASQMKPSNNNGPTLTPEEKVQLEYFIAQDAQK